MITSWKFDGAEVWIPQSNIICSSDAIVYYSKYLAYPKINILHEKDYLLLELILPQR